MKHHIFTAEERFELASTPHISKVMNSNVYSTDISYLIYEGEQRAYLSATKDLATKEIVVFNVGRDLSMQTAFIGLEETLK